jgi:(2R)-3-sulfolactate dehydrogenase (NADP+)
MSEPAGDYVTLTIDAVEALTQEILEASNTSEANARSVTRSVVAAELDGIHSHGLARLPTYCEHARCGKIDGQASPAVEQVAPAALRADANDGFAHPAIDLGFSALIELAKTNGMAGLSVTNSYNCGVLGYHVETLASAGLVALGYTNAPASIAPAGGKKAVFGTNPVACAAPDGKGGVSFVIDQSSSVIARSEVMVHAASGKPIPEGWAYDSEGRPTTDPAAAMKGTMVPAGGYKGAGTALIVELMAAALSGATLSAKASSFGGNEGGSPRTGQFFIAINPGPFSGGNFEVRMADLVSEITGQQGARLPGSRRRDARAQITRDGVTFAKSLHEKLLEYRSR